MDEGRFFEENRTVEEQMGKLRWRCRRGMKELDLLTLGYLERHYSTAPAGEQQAFADLLELQDPLLMSYMVGRETPADATAARVVGVMRTLLNDADDA
jgi:antitoxin CptB